MAEYITVDSGTTNTRLRLVCNGAVTDTLRYAVGARTVVQGRPVLRETLREGIAALLRGMKVEDAIARMEGIRCGFKSTSCPDQIAKALKTVQ